MKGKSQIVLCFLIIPPKKKSRTLGEMSALLTILWSSATVVAATAESARKDVPYDYSLDHPISTTAPEFVIPYVRPKDGRRIMPLTKNDAKGHPQIESLNMNSVGSYKADALLLDAEESQGGVHSSTPSAPFLRSLPYGMETARAIGSSSFIETAETIHRNMWRSKHKNSKKVASTQKKATMTTQHTAAADPFYAKYSVTTAEARSTVPSEDASFSRMFII